MRRSYDSPFLAALFVLLVSAAAPVLAAPGIWEPIGPPAADVQAFAIAPSSPARVYLATYRDGVYRSDDRGGTWSRFSAGLPYDELPRSLSVSPTDPDVVLVGFDGGMGVYRTDDGGRTWVPSGAGLQAGTVSSLAHLGDTGVVLAGVGGIPGPEKGFGIYRSADGGKSWRLVTRRRWPSDSDAPGPRPSPVPPNQVVDFGVHPSDPRIVLANGRSALLRSDDAGLSWSVVFESVGGGDVEFSPADPNVVFACRSVPYQLLLLKSTDGGLTFSPVAMPGGAHLLAFHPTDPDRLLMAWGYDDLSYEDPTFTTYVYSTTDQGSTWSTVFTSPQWNQRPTSLAYDPEDPQVTYVGMTGDSGSGPGSRRGFYRSDAGGAPQSWQTAMDGIGNSGGWTIEVDSRGRLFTHENGGLRLSTDAGHSWSALPPHGLAGTAASARLEAVQRTPDLLWHVGFWFSWDIGGPFAYRSTDCGQTWSPADYPVTGLPQFGDGFRAVTVDHGSGSTVYVWEDVYSSPFPLYRSDDGGDSFQQAATVAGFRDAVIDPTSEQRIVVAAATAPVVRVSGDGGVTWSPLDAGLPADPAVRILMDPDDPDRLTAVFQAEPPYRSTDGGQTWAPLPVDLAGDTVVDADWNPTTGEVFLATAASGVLSSERGALNRGLGTRNLRALRYSEADRSVLVATANGGIRRLALPRGEDTPERPAAVRAASSPSVALRALPNPTRSGPIRVELTAPHGTPLDVAVFDVTGRRVQTLVADRASDFVVWDGRDASGERAAAGVYLIRMQAGDESVTRRVTLVR